MGNLNFFFDNVLPICSSITTLSHLNCYLEAIETSCLWNLDFLAETLNQVFIDNAIASSEESKNMLDEIPFIILSYTGKKKRINDQTATLNFFYLHSCPHPSLWRATYGTGPVGNFFQGIRTCALLLPSEKSKD